MFEILRWVSLVLMWVATVLNVLEFCTNIRFHKKWKQTVECYETSINEMRAARDRYMEATKKLGLTQQENDI